MTRWLPRTPLAATLRTVDQHAPRTVTADRLLDRATLAEIRERASAPPDYGDRAWLDRRDLLAHLDAITREWATVSELGEAYPPTRDPTLNAMRLSELRAAVRSATTAGMGS